ncbi:hypothetical protein QVG61_07850 [Thiohalobacter sp. IOR34]|uniref:hypothetical protein n=1 Tax=Thiohalobacter sp. IOR34 TaxID=3057176 RepID=UPI0025B0B0B1|nr:hypothetical protein [Thiohalobacter sp. IOR34]WJW74430.1 hypothetical protein QVG61_07850 [Thiohalobacter sp. IOR34]
MTDEKKPDQQPKHRDQDSDPATEGPAGSRRRFVKSALVTAPVMLTVASRPALAGARCTLSGMMSGNLSGPTETCEGCTPGYWRQQQHFGSWMSPYSPTDPKTFWTDVLPAFPGMPAGLTLIDALCLKGGNYNALARHTVAALLNGAYNRMNPGGLNFGYTDQDVIDLYTDHYMSDVEKLKNTFALLNERSCPLGFDPGDSGGSGPGCANNSGGGK